MSELSRRDFLKGSLAGAASLALAGIGLSAVKNFSDFFLFKVCDRFFLDLGHIHELCDIFL